MNESLGAPLSLLISIILLHPLASGIVWIIFQQLTKNSRFRNSESLDKPGNCYPWLLSLLLTVALLQHLQFRVIRIRMLLTMAFF